MNDVAPSEPVPAVKDESSERAIPTAWRPAFQAIVAAFIAGDFALKAGVAGVEPLPEEIATHIRSYVADYGATLTHLPEDTWASSVCIWYGDHWKALVDLWTEQEGRSDLVLHADVTDAGPGFSIRVTLVYVP